MHRELLNTAAHNTSGVLFASEKGTLTSFQAQIGRDSDETSQRGLAILLIVVEDRKQHAKRQRAMHYQMKQILCVQAERVIVLGVMSPRPSCDAQKPT